MDNIKILEVKDYYSRVDLECGCVIEKQGADRFGLGHICEEHDPTIDHEDDERFTR